MQRLPKEEIKTDVLVIGGGAAGLMAALEAKTIGLDVAIVSKSKVGKSGNTVISGAGMAILAPDPDSKDSACLFSCDTYRSGKEINDRDMVGLYIKGTMKIIDKLTRYGVVFKQLENQYIKKRPPGHSVARLFSTDFSTCPYLNRGLSLTLPLLRSARNSGVKIIDFAPVIKLLTKDGQVAGAVAISKKSGSMLVFRTNVVTLACGGGGMIFSKSNNTRDITGDSYALAYDSGALLRDMEFVQFYPTMMFAPVKVTISSPLFGEGAFLRNALSERFMRNYDKMGDMATRDIMTRAIFTEITEGRGSKGSIFMDCRQIDPNKLATRYTELLRLLRKVGIDPLKELIPISPATHFFMGGIHINEETETTVKGLLACGESVGGLHGANRLGGNALSEALVFGALAGRQAAKLLKKKSEPEMPACDLMPFQNGSLSISELKQALRRISWKYLSIVRNQKYGKTALSEINQISDALKKVKIGCVRDLIDYYELKGMVTTSHLILKGAMVRKESRGAHFRSDFRNLDDATYKGSFFYQKLKGDMKIQFHPGSLYI
jgi:succinate dehydrogenase/fumarate reductase flavoprotein subunit